jgi:two-component system, NarL family, sensor histidine kinase UhpB
MRILVIEDNEGDYFLVHEYLHEIYPNIEIKHNTLLQDAINSLKEISFDIILLDLSLPDSNGTDSIIDMVKLANGIPVIVLTGFGNLQFAVDSLKLGVQDYLLKDDVNPMVLQKSIGYSIERNKISTTLRVSESKYRYLFDNNPDFIFIFNPVNYIILDVNETAAQILGYTKAEFLEMKIWDIYEVDDQEEIDHLVKNLTTNKASIHSKIVKSKSNAGSTFYTDLALHKINYNGVDAVLTIGTDVTENVLLEQKLADERRRKTREIAEAVIIAQERERREIGLELHDNVNQILAGSLMYLGLLKKELKVESDLYKDIEKLITEAIQEIRTLSHNLIPPSLNELELGDALDHIISIAKKTTVFDIQKDLYDFKESEISNDLKLTIYRIIQEQFNNILKHARAKQILIRLYQEADKVILCIKDNGRGFDTSTTTHGVGLINIQTRASLFKGEMKINSSPGNGTEVIVTFQI